MGIREEMTLARKRAGLSQARLADRAQGWNPGNVSHFESGAKGASLETIESWMDACGMQLVAVPKGPTSSPRELAALPEELLEILLRLARVLPWMPMVLVKDLRGRIESWADDYPPRVSTLATTQETVDSAE